MAASEPRARILAVDDDDLVLGSLQGLITLETDHELQTFSDPQEAVKELEKNPFDIIISDFLMPGMNGLEFLKEARRLQPDAARILLTGFADKQNAIRAINEVGLYHYLEKPWENDHLLLLIRNALEQKTLRRQLTERVEEFKQLTREHTDLADRHRVLERELEMAARVQRSLLPDGFSQVDGFRVTPFYRPTKAVGGDYYDVQVRDKTATWLISDVSGHGVQAALTSMLLKAIFQQTAAEAPDPKDLLREMNDKLHEFLPGGMYVAAAVLHLNPHRRQIHLANAGLPYPLLLSQDTEKAVQKIPVAGLPLGLFPKSVPDHYDSRELELSGGDLLLVSSDGLGEIRGKGEEFFEDKALEGTLQSLRGKAGNEVVEQLTQSALSFGGDKGPADDLTLVCVERV